MNLTCPCCGSSFPLVAGANDAEARRFAALMGELPPPVARLMLHYVQLHKPLKQGLKWSKAVGVVADLVAEIKSATLQHDGRAWAAPMEHWTRALETVVDMDSLTLPLKGNGLLRKILAGLVQKSAGATEQKKEQQQRYRQNRDSSRGAQPIAVVADRAANAAAARELKGVLK